jgi:hypothetical protein
LFTEDCDTPSLGGAQGKSEGFYDNRKARGDGPYLEYAAVDNLRIVPKHDAVAGI